MRRVRQLREHHDARLAEVMAACAANAVSRGRPRAGDVQARARSAPDDLRDGRGGGAPACAVACGQAVCVDQVPMACGASHRLSAGAAPKKGHGPRSEPRPAMAIPHPLPVLRWSRAPAATAHDSVGTVCWPAVGAGDPLLRDAGLWVHRRATRVRCGRSIEHRQGIVAQRAARVLVVGITERTTFQNAALWLSRAGGPVRARRRNRCSASRSGSGAK